MDALEVTRRPFVKCARRAVPEPAASHRVRGRTTDRGHQLTSGSTTSSRSTPSTSPWSRGGFGFLGSERRGEDVDDAHDRVRVAASPSGTLRIFGLDPAVDGPKIRFAPRRGAAGGQPRHRAHRARQPRDLRALLRPAASRSSASAARSCSAFMQLDRPTRRPRRPAVGRHEATAHDRACARQPTRAAAARRAHHRPRPAGAPPPVGALLPTEARRA